MNHLPASVSLSVADQPSSQFPIWEIAHATCKARVALHGAQVLSWHPAGEEEVLYLSPQSHFTEGKAIRGGIPLCWPWFSAHASNPSFPSHGFARTRFWELESVTERAEGIDFRFFTRWEDLEAKAEIFLGETLELRVATKNVSKNPCALGGAWHSYFQVGEISDVTVEGLENSLYVDTLGDRTPRRQIGAIIVDREVDANYESNATVKILDFKKKRVILIEKSGCPSTVVWNPWIAKTATMKDLPDESYREFICVEPAILNSEAFVLAPGESFVFATKICVGALPQ